MKKLKINQAKQTSNSAGLGQATSAFTSLIEAVKVFEDKRMAGDIKRKLDAHVCKKQVQKKTDSKHKKWFANESDFYDKFGDYLN